MLVSIIAKLVQDDSCVEEVSYFYRNDYSPPHLYYSVVWLVIVIVASTSNAIDLLLNYCATLLHLDYL